MNINIKVLDTVEPGFYFYKIFEYDNTYSHQFLDDLLHHTHQMQALLVNDLATEKNHHKNKIIFN